MAMVPGGDRQVEILIRRLDPELPLPTYAQAGDAGADLVTAIDIELGPGERLLVPTGVAIALPDGFAAFVHPRSGLAARFGLGIVNAPGTVDAGYRGEIKVLVINHDPRERIFLSRGTRIAQLVVQRVEQVRFHEVQLLPGSARGEGGYGSTGDFVLEVPPREREVPPPQPEVVPREPEVSAREPEVAPREPVPSQEADMSLFRRGSSRSTAPEPEEFDQPEVSDLAPEEFREEVPATPTRASGPYDISEVPDPGSGGRVDLGGMWVPAFEGLEIRVEAEPETGVIVSVTLILGESALQLQPFAAPRSGGIWSEVRTEMAAGLTAQGGTADQVEGPLGIELRAKVPARMADGSSGVEPARFLGVDGPRWFLRGALTGRAAYEPDEDEPLVAVFQDVVVVRGTTPMAPREPIPLRLPDTAQTDEADDVEDDALAPFERGPEITEIR